MTWTTVLSGALLQGLAGLAQQIPMSFVLEGLQHCQATCMQVCDHRRGAAGPPPAGLQL